jgi:hypothetical protein
MIMIHYICSEWNGKFIIAKTECGIDWIDVKDFTEDKELVTCKKCLKQIENK